MNDKKKRIYALPLYIVLFAPLAVHGRLVNTGLSDFAWFSGQGEVFDVFLFAKKNVILFASFLILLFGAIMLIKRDLGQSLKELLSVFLPFGIYVALALASSVCSPHRAYAWNGMMEQYESVFVIAGYFLICVYAYMACYKAVFMAFGIFCGIFGGIGTLQLFGMDIYRTEFFRRMLMPKGMEGITFEITADAGRSYCSLSNPNDVGMLCCLTMPMLVMLAICARTWHGRILYSVSGILMFLSLLGSRSKSGIAVFTVCMFLSAVLFRKSVAAKLGMRQKNVDVMILCMAFAMCIVSGALVYKWGEFWRYDDRPDTEISRIVTNDGGVEIVYRGKELFICVNDDGAFLDEVVKATDENGQSYSVSEEDGTLYFHEKALSGLTVSLAQYGEYVALEVFDGNFYWYFTNQADGRTWQYLTRYGKPDQLDSSAVSVCRWLEGKERIVNGRGYIWSRTIPLMKKTIFLGSGQDSFAVAFPNNDYLGKARWGYKGMLITKPHCMYMQIAVQSGLVSLIALFIFWGRFLCKAFTGKMNGVQTALLKAAAVGAAGYLLMGFTNDSNVGAAPVFWLIVGVGWRMINA